MGQNSKIGWTDATFNPVWGCTKVGPGCDNCYAESFDRRVGGDHWGPGKPRREFGDKHWAEPLKWNAAAEKLGIPTKVFCASMADVFDNEWPEHVRPRLFKLIRETPHLTWILLTKRIGNAAKMLPEDWGDGYPNVWLLATVVNQEEADRDVPKVLRTPARVRGLSIEPQIEAIRVPLLVNGRAGYHTTERGRPDGEPWVVDGDGNRWSAYDVRVKAVDWIICGSESGHHRRSFDLDWARSLRDQCQAAGVPFFLKQLPGGPGPKYVIEAPELDGRSWTEFPSHKET